MKNDKNRAIGFLAAAILVASALLVLMPVDATAQETQESNKMYACYMQSSGVVYRINPPDVPGQDPKLKDECTSEKHVKFYWVELAAADGKVGIGVPEPQAELDVAGDIHASGKLIVGNTIFIDDATNSITSTDGTISFGNEDLFTTGKIGIGTTEPDTDLEVVGQIKITGGSPGAGKVLTSDADGLASWTDIVGGGVIEHGLLVGLDVDDHTQYILGEGVRNSESGFAVTGTFNSSDTGPLPVSGQGARLMWYPALAAFRAGYAHINEWDLQEVGPLSAAMGNSSIASGSMSFAVGQHSVASAHSSIAMGAFATASGRFGSAAIGNGARAEGSSSVAMGSGTLASGSISTALGNGTTAEGSSSTAMGRGTWAQSYAAIALGRYNAYGGDRHNWVATDPVLMVGNGTSESSRSNALTLLKNGDLTVAGRFTADGTIESTAGGIKFPDGSVQTTSATALSVTRRSYSFSVSAGTMSFGSATCAAGEVATGGGLTMTDDPNLNVWENYPNNSNGWKVSISNYGGAARSVTVYVICLKG
jgi:hypothetical protein